MLTHRLLVVVTVVVLLLMTLWMMDPWLSIKVGLLMPK